MTSGWSSRRARLISAWACRGWGEPGHAPFLVAARRAIHPTTSTTLFDPYGLIYYDGDLFALGYPHAANDWRIFKVSRIEVAELKDATAMRSLCRALFWICRTRSLLTPMITPTSLRVLGTGCSSP